MSDQDRDKRNQRRRDKYASMDPLRKEEMLRKKRERYNTDTWVDIQLGIDGIDQDPSYTSCPQCMYSISASPDEDYLCYRCHATQKIMLRCKVNITATDHSGSYPSIIYDETAEKLLGHDTRQMYHMPEQKIQELLRTTHEQVRAKKFKAQVRATKKRSATGMNRLTIHQLQVTDANDTEQVPLETAHHKEPHPAPPPNQESKDKNSTGLEATINKAPDLATLAPETLMKKPKDIQQKQKEMQAAPAPSQESKG